MIYKGNQKIKNIYKGSQKIKKIYKGNQLVYEKGKELKVINNGMIVNGFEFNPALHDLGDNILGRFIQKTSTLPAGTKEMMISASFNIIDFDTGFYDISIYNKITIELVDDVFNPGGAREVRYGGHHTLDINGTSYDGGPGSPLSHIFQINFNRSLSITASARFVTSVVSTSDLTIETENTLGIKNMILIKD